MFLENELKKAPNTWMQVYCDNRNALHPVIKAVDGASGMNCTFSFGSGVRVEASKRLLEYNEVFPLSKQSHFFIT